MENERNGSVKRAFPKFGLLDHYLINLFRREENYDDVAGVLMELFILIPDYGKHIEEMKRLANRDK